MPQLGGGLEEVDEAAAVARGELCAPGLADKVVVAEVAVAGLDVPVAGDDLARELGAALWKARVSTDEDEEEEGEEREARARRGRDARGR